MLRLAAVLLMLTATSAHALDGWMTKSEDDIFTGGQTANMVGFGASNESVYISCDSDRNLEFAVITKTDVDDAGTPAELVVKIDGGDTLRFDASSYPHNDQYLGFRSTDQEAIKHLVGEIGGARRTALFGLNVPSADWKTSINPGVRGSTKAAADFLKACVD